MAHMEDGKQNGKDAQVPIQLPITRIEVD